jgi:transcriptional regulator with XRE-family HTH domain
VETVQGWDGEQARRLRAALRMTVEDFAGHLGVSPRTVAKWEKKGALLVPLPETQAILDTALERASEMVRQRFTIMRTGEATETPLVSPHDELEALRARVHDSVATSVITDAGLDDWEQTALQYGQATRYRSAAPLLLDLASDCRELQRLLTLPQTVSASRRLTFVMAQMAGLVSLTLIKLGRGSASAKWARTARLAAHEASDPGVLSWVWAQEAYTAYYGNEFARAVEVARRAQAVAEGTISVGVALAAALEARAQGRLGEAVETRRALDVADTTLGRLNAESVIESAFGYNEAQLRFHQGNALTHLGDTVAAAAAHVQALQLYPATDYLDRALVQLDRAACLISDGEPKAGLAHATTTVASLTSEQREGIIDQRSAEIVRQLLPTQASLPEARELRSMIQRLHDERDDLK